MSTAVGLLAEAETEAQAGNAERAYEMMVKAGRIARLAHDGSNWELGDIGDKVDIAWGEERLQRWAEDVGVTYPKAREVRRVARAWPAESRQHYGERYPGLTWSHFQAAAGHRDQHGEPDGNHWLMQAGDQGWTIAEFREHLRQTPLPASELGYLEGLETFLAEALGDESGGAEYIAAIRARLEEKHRQRGAASVANPTRDVMAEIREEGLDVAAWAWIGRVQAQYHEWECDAERLKALMRLGCAVWREAASRDI